MTLVAVTNAHPPENVRAATAAGVSDVGKNRVQELAEKAAAVGRGAVCWHLVGHLQGDKLRQALPLFDLLHPPDLPDHARGIRPRAREVAGFRARHLSMGMSNDFEVAVEEGATMVRVGSSIFGERGA